MEAKKPTLRVMPPEEAKTHSRDRGSAGSRFKSPPKTKRPTTTNSKPARCRRLPDRVRGRMRSGLLESVRSGIARPSEQPVRLQRLPRSAQLPAIRKATRPAPSCRSMAQTHTDPPTCKLCERKDSNGTGIKKETLRPVPGAPQVAVTKSFDTGLVKITEVDPIVKCSPSTVFPPTTTSCTSFVATGVQLERTGRRATPTRWRG